MVKALGHVFILWDLPSFNKRKNKKKENNLYWQDNFGFVWNAFENSSTKIVIEKSSHLFSRSKFYLKDGTVYF